MLNFVGLSGIILLTKNRILSIKANKNMISKSILLLCIISLYIVINELNSININDYGYLRIINVLNIDFGYDGIGLIFLILTIYLGIISIISNWENIIDKRGTYMILLMILVILMGLNFVCLDLISFYIFFESTLIPLYLIIGIYGGSKKNKAAYYILIYTLCSSLFMLLSIVLIYVIYNNVDYVTINSKIISIELQSVLLIGLMIGLGVKTPLVPVHTWLPIVHSESPLGGSILLAGKIMLALNLTICWKDHKKWFISRKLSLINKSNLLNSENINNDITLDKILRGQTLNINTKLIDSYLTGLIEGNGCIYVPKNIKGNPSISLSMNSKELPLLMLLQKEIEHGNFYKMKGKKAYEYTIGNFDGMLKIINYINGNMRTKKILKLYELIDFFKQKYPEYTSNLEKLPLDESDISSNAWLSGFTDANGCFYVRVSKNNNCNTHKVLCNYELSQALDNNEYTKNILEKISKFFLVELKEKRTKTTNLYLIKTNSYKSNDIVINYFNKYSLFSSKYLDFSDWSKIYYICKNKEKEAKLEIIINTKSKMNSSRTYFNWNHLNKFNL